MEGNQVTGVVSVEPLEDSEGSFDVADYSYDTVSGEVLEATDGEGRLPEPGTTFASYNTFLGQENWLRLSTTDETVGDGMISVYDSSGALVSENLFWIGPDYQVDVNLSEAPFNVPGNTYGMIKITREPSTLTGTILADVIRLTRGEESGGIETMVSVDLE